MRLRLVLIRHAKSSWDDPALPDHARPLSARGRDAAPRIGRWLATRGILPDVAISSDATRAAQTLDLVLSELPARPEILWRPRLYHAPPAILLDVLERAEEPTVLMVGHNPGLADFAHALVRTRPDHARFADYPTGATTVIDFEAERWSDLALGTGRVVAFVVPRDLPPA